MMKKNVGGVDRAARIVLGAVAIAVGVYIGSWWGLVGVPLFLTGLFRFCGLYTLLGVSTCPMEEPKVQGATPSDKPIA